MKPKIITALAHLILVMSSFATTIKYDGPWMWNDLNVKTTTSIGNSGYPVIVTCTGTIEISGYKNEVASLEIPKKIEWTAEEWGENYLEYGDHILLTKVVYDLDVVAIADNAFNGGSYSRYEELETISIPSTVIKIGYQAFCWCTGLKSIAIPNGVTEIGESCFYHCTSLTSVTLPNQIKVIPRSCFYCTALRDVTIPASVVEIGDAAFYYTAIDTVNLSANCKLLGSDAFAHCLNLKRVTIENVSQITQSQFSGSTNIEELVLGDGVRDVGVSAFYNRSSPWDPCEGLPHLHSLTLGNNITNIGAQAFYCAGRAPNTPSMSVVIPPSVKSIGDYAFAYMYNVTNLVVQGVPKVDQYQFQDMTNLVSLTFGPGVQEVTDDFCYSYFYNLKRVNFESDDMKRIGSYAFQGDYNRLEEVTLPRSLESLGDEAFYGSTANCRKRVAA